MAGEDRETLDRIYAAWERGDFAAPVELFDPAIVLRIDPEIPDAGVYEGIEGVRNYSRHFLSAWETVTIAAESVRDAGDRFLVKVDQRGVGLDSGAEVAFGYFQVWTFRDGRVVRLESIRDEAEAREAAGLSGPERPKA
jgi:ketosteroid isomerase-like protein